MDLSELMSVSPEKEVPSYQLFRAEGLSLKESLPSTVSYILKYIFKKPSAPQEILNYFEHQKKLMKLFRQQEVKEELPTLAFVGDVMWIRHSWESFVSTEVNQKLASYSLLFGNLESPVDSKQPVPHRLPDYLSYNSHPGLVRSFNYKGKNVFSALSTTNNHSLDRGVEGLRNTIQFLDDEKIPHSGVRFKEDSRKKYLVFEVSGIKVGFFATAWGLNDPSLLNQKDVKISYVPGLARDDCKEFDLTEVQEVLREMDEEGIGFKVLSIHWGHEYEFYPTSKIMTAAHRMVAMGADVIIGSHPHVFQPNEICFVNGYERTLGAQFQPWFTQSEAQFSILRGQGANQNSSSNQPRKALICYSMGNFVSRMWTFLCQAGMIQSLSLKKNLETQRVDWCLPRTEFVYNQVSNEGHQLLLLDSYLKRLKESDPKRWKKLQKDVAFIQEHMAV